MTEEKCTYSIQVTELQGEADQMIAEIDRKDDTIAAKDEELADCYRRIKELSAGAASSEIDMQAIANEKNARALAEHKLQELRHEFAGLKTLSNIKEDNIMKLKRELEQALRSGSPVGGQRLRALEAEILGLKAALADALGRVSQAEEAAARANSQASRRTAPVQTKRSRPILRQESQMRPPPNMIKPKHTKFSQRYAEHILSTQC